MFLLGFQYKYTSVPTSSIWHRVLSRCTICLSVRIKFINSLSNYISRYENSETREQASLEISVGRSRYGEYLRGTVTILEFDMGRGRLSSFAARSRILSNRNANYLGGRDLFTRPMVGI